MSLFGAILCRSLWSGYTLVII